MPKLLVKNPPPQNLDVCLRLEPPTDAQFEPEAIVPSGDWISAKTMGDSQVVRGAWVGYSPESLLADNIAILRVPRVLEADDKAILETIDQVCRTLSSSPDSLDHKGKYYPIGSGALLSTTIHPVSRKYVGLHVDSFERRVVSELGRARNRLCVNLGPHTRWFCFSPLEISDVAAALGLGPFDLLNTNGFRKYALAFLPAIFRVRMEPGDAYIAPTERLLHDGQAVNREPTCIYTVFGHFDRTHEAYDLSVV
jgi:hypothetical protein